MPLKRYRCAKCGKWLGLFDGRELCSNCEEFADELISIQDAYEQAKEDIYQHVLNKEHNTDKAQGILNALEMIVERLDKVIWKD